MGEKKQIILNTWDRTTSPNDEFTIRSRRMKKALADIRAGIIQQRGSLDGILDEFLAERREQAACE